VRSVRHAGGCQAKVEFEFVFAFCLSKIHLSSWLGDFAEPSGAVKGAPGFGAGSEPVTLNRPKTW